MDKLNHISNSNPLHCYQLGPSALFEENTGNFWNTVWTGDFKENEGFFMYSEESGVFKFPNSDEVARSDFCSFAFGASGNLFFASEYDGNVVVIDNTSNENYNLIEFSGQTPVLFSQRNVIYNKSNVLCYYHKYGDSDHIYYRSFEDNFQTENTGFVVKNTKLIGIYYPTGDRLSYKLLYKNNKSIGDIEILTNYELFDNRLYEDYSGVNNIPNNQFYGWNKKTQRKSLYIWDAEDFSGVL